MTSENFKERIKQLKEVLVLPEITTSNGIELPSASQAGEWNMTIQRKIIEIISELETFSYFFTDEFKTKIIKNILNINRLYVNLLTHQKLEDGDKFNDAYKSIYNEILNLEKKLRNPKIEKLNINELSRSVIDLILSYLIDKNGLVELRPTIESIKYDLNFKELNIIINLIIDFNNLDENEKQNRFNSFFLEILNFYKDSIDKKIQSERNIINNDIKQLQNNRKEFEQFQTETLKDIEKAKSGMIITAFKDRSSKADDYITILYFLITLLFIIIISSFIFRMSVNHESTFKIGQFVYFLSYIIATSGLLAFLIKEKNRLVEQRDYFERCHTELRALTTYVVNIDPKKVEDLKIDLAHKYFNGGSINQNSEKSEIGIPNENIKQILELLNTLQKNNKTS